MVPGPNSRAVPARLQCCAGSAATSWRARLWRVRGELAAVFGVVALLDKALVAELCRGRHPVATSSAREPSTGPRSRAHRGGLTATRWGWPWVKPTGRQTKAHRPGRFLPPTGVDEYVELAAGQAEVLDASLNSRAKLKHVYCGVALSPSQGWIGVALEGVPIGRLVGGYPLVRAAEQAGFPLTARAMLRRDPDRGFRLQVFAPVTY